MCYKDFFLPLDKYFDHTYDTSLASMVILPSRTFYMKTTNLRLYERIFAIVYLK